MEGGESSWSGSVRSVCSVKRSVRVKKGRKEGVVMEEGVQVTKEEGECESVPEEREG